MLAFLAGCSEVPTRSAGQNDIERQNLLEQIKRWNLKGRLSLTSKKESGTASFHWSQDNERFLMRFIAPLGQGTYALRGGEGNGVYLLTSKNKVLRANNAETLLEQSVGWQIPLSGFRYWIRGLSKPGIKSKNTIYDVQGRVTEMQQADWHISIKRYMDVEGVDLPAKIFIQNDHFKLKLIIQTWDTNL